MTQIPEGWYPDPSATPGAPGSLRWWDGSQWTGHLAPATTYAGQATRATTTPDGVPLAGWGSRLGAYLIDGLIVGVLGLLVGLPFVVQVFHRIGDYVDRAVQAQQEGRQPPSSFSFYTDNAGPFLALAAISLAVNLAYHVGFLKAFAATPGKLMLGLRVRLRETPGPLTWGTVLRRWLGQFGYALLSWIPVLGSILGLYVLVDCLWPLWDERRQALHDKFAQTNVVRVR